MAAEIVEFPAPAVRVRCPDCRGRGCEWCDHTGRWLDVTAEKAAGLARLLAQAGQADRAGYYHSKARALESSGPACPRCGASCQRARGVPAWSCPDCGNLWRYRFDGPTRP